MAGTKRWMLTLLLLAACASAPEAPRVATVSAPQLAEPPALPPPAGVPVEPPLISLAHGASQCAEEVLPHVFHQGVPTDSSIEVRASKPLDEGSLAPGDHLELSIEVRNTSDTAEVFGVEALEAFTRAEVGTATARWALPVRVAGPPFDRGGTLAPGESFVLCVAFDVPERPITAARAEFSPRRGRLSLVTGSRIYTLALGRADLVPAVRVEVRYPHERPPRWGPSSWGGLILAELSDPSAALSIAEETGTLLGSAVSFVTHPNLVVMQGDSDALARLEAHPGVVSARAVLRGERGTEGCSVYGWCDPGEICCPATSPVAASRPPPVDRGYCAPRRPAREGNLCPIPP